MKFQSRIISWVAFLSVYADAFSPHVAGRWTASMMSREGREGKRKLIVSRLLAYPVPTNEDELLSQLKEYIKVRNEAMSKQQVDGSSNSNEKKAMGGSRGNFFLEFTSTAPQVIDADNPEEKGVLDYDELTKYGFTHLVKPIMQSGGRNALYSKLGLTPPPVPERLRPKTARKLEIDRDGEKNPNKYTGLKMTTLINDDEMADALTRAAKKGKKQASLEEEFKVPFSDAPKKKFKETPDWTPEMLDKDAEVRGRAISWAKKQRLERERGRVRDGSEDLAIEGSLRVYCCLTLLTTAVAFGKASTTALIPLGISNLDVLQAPALGLDVASLGSSIVAAGFLAPQKNRNSFVWGVKGLFGGPSAILQLRQLEEINRSDPNN
mmetsp:Transcript_19529/g.25294  ORF Transcript_19529/g.25294 Transcript_19529/m.25294 type:complete len:379 (-) Transcript_19529:144-1280(-)